MFNKKRYPVTLSAIQSNSYNILSFYVTELSHCRLHIQEIYKTTRFNIQKGIWQQLHPKHFVNVLLIHHSERSTGKEFFYVATMMKHGLALNRSRLLINKYNESILIGEYLQSFTKSIESFETIKTKEISDIFQPFKSNDGSTTNPKYILIEGAPGMGKTTLCKEIAYQWATNSLLKDTELLFLIYLHDPAIKDINCLKDLVHYQYGFLKENDELSKQCAEFLNHRDGIDLMIVLDGYDEYNSSSGSIITKILDRKVLPQCRILVTSRLTASKMLHGLADIRVEVLGFTDESKAQYIKQELKDHPDEIHELQTYLNTNASIKSICYMPMMMTILVFMFKEKGCLSNNSTKLYEKFIALTICHHLQKHKISGDVFVSLQTLPSEYKSLLTDLSKFAFLTLQNKQKVFSKEDITNLCPDSSLASFNLESFGIINSVKYFCTDKGYSLMFSFLHLSIHEYLAAYYLNCIDQYGQFKELETTFLNEMYQETWNMFVTMNKDTWFSVQNYFIYCKDMYRESLSHWISNIKSSFLESFLELYDILNFNAISKEVVQVLFFKSDQCSSNESDAHQEHDEHQEQIYISLCDQNNVHQAKLELFVINKDIKDNSNWFILLENLVNRFSVVFYKDHILMLSKSYQEQVVDFFKYHTSLTQIMFQDCFITTNTIDAIKLSCLQHLLYLVISSCTIEQNVLTKLTDYLSSISTLLSITFQDNKVSAELIKIVSSVIVSNCNLKFLNLRNNQLQNEIIEIAKALEHTRTLEVLNLRENNIPEGAATAISNIINSNTSIKAFYIGNNNLKLSIVVILKFLNKLSSLKVLDLSDNKIPEEASEAIASVVLHNPRLEELYLAYNNLNIGILKVATALQHISTLRILSLDKNNNISQEACDELALAIKSNKHLKSLWLSDNNLRSSTNVILKSLTTITTLTVLNLNNNQIPQEADEVLASVIMHNTGLEELYLYGNSLNVGALKLAQALQYITTLRILDLGNNNIPQEACDELALAIKSNKHLKKLWLNDNNLHSLVNIILNSLTTITTLTMLNLTNNQIPQEADEVLASVIKCNTQLEELYLYGNNLGIGTLKIAQALQHITTLRMLSLDNNNIPHEAFDELALAIKSNKHLNSLWLSDNNLHSSTNVILKFLTTTTTLTLLNLNYNQKIEGADEVLTSVILCNTQLEELHLYGNNLYVGTLKLAKALQHITTLRILGLGKNNNIPQEVCNELALAIKSNKHLKKLWLNHNNLHSSVNILKSLTTITTLTVLNLNNNQIPQEADEVLASVIKCNTQLEELYLNDNDLGIGTLKIAQALQHITTLTMLSLDDNNIPQEACNELALAIKTNKHLKKLWLSNSNLRSSVIVILNSLTTITTLTVLGLDNNQITQEADEVLASVIMHNTGLEELYLRDNNLGAGALKIAKALQCITTLRILWLSNNNNIPQEACDELALAIKSNKHLKKLWLNDNNLHSSAIIILKSLTTITTLTVLDLDNNQIPQEADEVLASVIMHNTGLEELYLSDNNLGAGALKIAKALQCITTLRILGLGNSNIPQEACDELALTVKLNKHLKQFELYDNNNLHSSIVIILRTLQTISNLNLLNIFGNTITEEAGNMLPSIISRNVEIQNLQLNLLITPLKVIEALQNLSALQILVFCTCNISKQIEIKLASVIIKNKSLTWLSLPNIKLSQHVILQAMATISNLTTVWLEDNLLSEQMSDDLSLVISTNKSLENLILLDNILKTGLIKIVKACNKLSNIKVLQLAHNCIIPSKVVELTTLITQNTSLERVLLGGITLSAAESSHLNVNTVLHKTDTASSCNNTSCVISSNHCTSLEMIYLEMLRKQIDNTRKCLYDAPIHLNAKNFSFVQKIYHYCEHNNITQLKIQQAKQKLEQVDAKKMISSLCILEKVKVIDLENNNIDEDASFELATVLHSNNVLEQLWLRGNRLNTAGALYILNSLEHLTTLNVLDLSYNNIGSESADGIAAVIDNNPLINQLWLDGNHLYCTGTIIICNALKKIKTLCILSLCNNGITDDVADELSAVITQNVLLEDLLLSNNQLHYTGIKIIAESLSKLIKLRKLDLFNNNISKEGASSLAIVLQNSTNLQDLFLSSNNLETSGALEICNALSHINSLHVLTLSNNDISDEVTSQLIEVLNNNHLYALLIGGNGLECGAVKIAQVIENDNIAMQLLDFSNNNISEQDKEEIKAIFSKRANFQFYV